MFLAVALCLQSTGPAPVPESRPAYKDGKPGPTIKVAGSMASALLARTPLVQDPVSFCIGDDGSIYVAESFRQEKGVEDNRSSKFWLEDDLQLRTVDDRLRMYEKWAAKREGGMDYYRRHVDRVMRLVDADGDGAPDRATNFSGDMNEPLDGTGAGVMWLDGALWYTCIPHLWRFRDTAGTGVADVRERVFGGFGVRVALRGHDMHGLVQGPDGRVYWSIGDRGYHVTTKEGATLARPHTGAVFRCEPDGSGLEVFAHSLRNPQELAFNQWGDLFTGDNNSDAGDRARIVYVMEGGETGWDMNYQTLEGANQRGPWSQERTWWTWDAADRGRPAWTLPPIAHLSDGPAGLCFYPGTGLAPRYANHFFLCDFLGGDSYSRILSFAVEPAGAGYAVVDAHPFVTEVLATDVDFGWDGRMYVSDWAGDGWFSDRTGELYAVWDPARIEDVDIRTAQNLVREGLGKQDDTLLHQCLAHADLRIRQRAHLELAARGERVTAQLASQARDTGDDQVPRLHALWALGVQARRAAASGTRNAAAESAVVAMLADGDVELRRLAARLAGDAGIASAAEPLVSLLTDDDLRVRAQACIALGKLRHADAIPNIAAVAWENEDQDPFLRHAAVMGLAGMGQPDRIRELASDQFAQTRLAAVLAMRRGADPQLARLLHDADLRVATEAARAINDLPIDEGMPALAALASKYAPDERAIADGASQAPKPTFERQLWASKPGFTAARLASDPVWATAPDRRETVEEAIGFSKAGNDYVQRVTGAFVAPADGDYAFAVASDDDGILLASTDGDPAHLKPIAGVEGYVNPGDFESQPAQRGVLALKAGDRVLLEARSFQGGGGNHLAMGVVHPDGRREQPIGSFAGDLAEMPLLRRVINANLRIGGPEQAAALASIASNPALPTPARLEAIEALADFLQPSPRDRVIGHWRPVDASGRSRDGYVAVLKQRLPSLATNAPAAVRTVARELAAKHGVAMDSGAALAAVIDAGKPVDERIACLMQLAQDRDAKLGEAIEGALASDQPRLRAQARAVIARTDPTRGEAMLVEALGKASVPEQQAALAALAALGTPGAEAAIGARLDALGGGTLPPALAVDVLAAADARDALKPRADALRASLSAKDALGAWVLCEEGGDAERGRRIVNFHSAAACLRCHMVEGTGGHAAPSLAGVGGRYDRRGLVASLVDPNAKVAEGFGPVSSMPAMGSMLTPAEVRDVVEYLATLR
jgi:putative membrane-bound dehydrogenase-like protein